ncbi:MAG: chloride channel protein [Flavobacteriales bacterium]|jgi:chloride channel protein, CIC family|nr:chloride channel protein [Flavobacteriales bacterium]
MLRKAWKFLKSDKAILVWASLVGVLAGLVAVLLKNGVSMIRSGIFSVQAFTNFKPLIGLGPIIGLLLTAWFVKKVLGGDHPGGGIPATLHALSTRRGALKRTWLFAPVVTSILSVGFGGSGGLEAPAVQAGATIGSEIASRTKRSFRRRRLLIACAATASLAAMFKAPIAALIFAIEVIMIDLTAASLVPLIFASLASLLTAYFLIEGEDILAVTELAPFAVKRLPFYITLGLIAGLGSVIFTRFYLVSSRAVSRFKNPLTRIITAGLILGCSVASFPSLYGEGYEVVNSMFMGSSNVISGELIPFNNSEGLVIIAALLFAWALKPILTGLTVGAGGVAGVFAPSLFCGALLGYTFALSVNMVFGPETIPVGNAVLAGLGGMMAGVLHAPLTAIFLASEISGGYELFVPLMLSSALSYSLSRYLVKNSIYTRELAERGELLTHDKDKSVLTLMSLSDEIERDFLPVRPDYTLGTLVRVVAKSKRNLHPVVDEEGILIGLLDLQDIRQIMFDRDKYETTTVNDLLVIPDNLIKSDEKMESVMLKFEVSGAWNLPVVDSKGKYLGFVSNSRLFGAYRKWLKETSGD